MSSPTRDANRRDDPDASIDELDDVQASPDRRGVPLRHAGISDLRYPMIVWDRERKVQHTVGTFRMTVDLPHDYKGTHMSRFVEALEAHTGEISMETVPDLVEDLRNRLDAERAHVRVDFPYFIRKQSPVTKSEAFLDLDCWFVGDAAEREAIFTLGVDVPVMTLCPCSRSISDRGAHCQRGTCRVRVRFRELVWIEEIVEWVESSASAPLFSLLKRSDEKWVTESSYDNPVFVEDLVRDVAVKLHGDDRVTWFEVEAENEESIHNHNAYAAVSSREMEAAPG